MRTQKYPMGPKAQAVHDRRMYIHRHNGLLGHIGRINADLRMIDRAPSITYDAHCMLQRLYLELDNLKQEVFNFRVEEDGRVATIIHDDKRAFRKEPVRRMRNGV